MGTLIFILLAYLMSCQGHSLESPIVKEVPFLPTQFVQQKAENHTQLATDEVGKGHDIAKLHDHYVDDNDTNTQQGNHDHIHEQSVASQGSQPGRKGWKARGIRKSKNKMKPWKWVGSNPDQMLIGGSETGDCEWPWQVSLQYLSVDNDWLHFCGGSLYKNQWVITAAHCIDKLQGIQVRVVLGEHVIGELSGSEQWASPHRMLVHRNYTEDEASGFPYDIGMVKLENPVIPSLHVQSVPVPNGQSFSSQDICYITGWGATTGGSTVASNRLLEAKMTVISKNDCRKVYGNAISDLHVCIYDYTETSSACLGDSGGPLVCLKDNQWVLTGIASWTGSEGCKTGIPNVYTRVSSFNSWIQYVEEHC